MNHNNHDDNHYNYNNTINHQQQQHHHWQAVQKSEYKIDHLNPLWNETTINLEQLCDGYYNKKLQIELWDYEYNGINRLVCKLRDEIDLHQLMSSKVLKGNADKTNALEFIEVDAIDEYLPGWMLIVLKADLDFIPTKK